VVTNSLTFLLPLIKISLTKSFFMNFFYYYMCACVSRKTICQSLGSGQ